jgi:predicted RNase H-like HicB family nuclease
MVETARYTYRVMWSPEDGEHVGLCAEFPSLSWLAPTPEEALSGIRGLVDGVIRDLKENNEPVPHPLTERRHSGKILLRTTPELHRELSIQAAETGVSLNRLINSRLHKILGR